MALPPLIINHNIMELQISWLIPQIQQLELQKSKLLTRALELEAEYRNSPAYLEWVKISQEAELAKQQEQELREQGKQIMLEKGLKTFTTLDWITIQLNATPWSLVVEKESEAELPDEYWRIKKEIDKTKLKKDYLEWKFYNDWVYINQDYNLKIK